MEHPYKIAIGTKNHTSNKNTTTKTMIIVRQLQINPHIEVKYEELKKNVLDLSEATKVKLPRTC